jgi:hypothetical protein
VIAAEIFSANSPTRNSPLSTEVADAVPSRSDRDHRCSHLRGGASLFAGVVVSYVLATFVGFSGAVLLLAYVVMTGAGIE